MSDSVQASNELILERSALGRKRLQYIPDTFVAMVLLKDGNKFEKRLDDAVWTHITPSSAKWMLASFYQADGILTAKVNKHMASLSPYINVRDSWEKYSELMSRLVEIHDLNGGRLLPDYSLSSSLRDYSVGVQYDLHLRTGDVFFRRKKSVSWKSLSV